MKSDTFRYLLTNVQDLIEHQGDLKKVGRNDNKLKIKDIVKNIEDLLILNDEAHHVYEDTAWKRAIEDINNSLKQKGKKLPLQIDVTATPKTKKGKIFTQTISDYPLVEAIYQQVVKKPVIPNETSREKLQVYSSPRFSERYRDYLHLGCWKSNILNIKNE